MSNQKGIRFWKLMIWTRLIIIGGVFIFMGCTSPPRTLDPSVSGPQVIVNPESIRLGVSKLIGTDVIFEGSGLKPGDSMFITLIGPSQVKAIVADAPIKPD